MYLNKEKGWTLIELMVVVIILGILVVIIVALFGNIISKTNESTTKGSLGALRSALSNYYTDREGTYPTNLKGSPFEGVYIDEIPEARLKKGISGNKSDQVVVDTAVDLTNVGGWLYNSDTGRITVNHYEVDTKGICYSTY